MSLKYSLADGNQGMASDKSSDSRNLKPDGQHPRSKSDSNSNKTSSREQLSKISGCQNLVSVLNDPNAYRSHSDQIFIKDWGSYFVEQPPTCPAVNVDIARMSDLRKRVARRTNLLRKFEELNRVKQKMRNSGMSRGNLDKIPPLLLKPDFNVRNEETLLFILNPNRDPSLREEGTVTISSSSVRQSQQTLSDLLDIVEDHLSNQISARFRDFFQIMNAMDLVMDQVTKTIREVTCVRKKCDHLKRTLVRPNIQTIHLTRVRSNLSQLLDKLSLMESVHQSSSKINIFLASKDYVRALDQATTSRQTVKEKLPGIKCCQNLDSELEEREKSIDQIMQQDLVKLLTSEWHQPLSLAPTEDYSCVNEDLLVSITLGLLRVNKSEGMIDVFREEACAAVITVMKQVLIEMLAAEDMDISNRLENHLFDQVRSIELSKWLQTLEKAFRKLSALLKRIKAVNSTMLRTIYAVHGKVWTGSDSSPAVKNIETIDSEKSFQECREATESSLIAISDFAQTRTSVFIERRLTDTSDKMSHSDFKKFSESVISFINDCDALSGKKNTSLELVLKSQASKFASRFHEERKNRLNPRLDIEQWKSIASLPEDFNALVARLANGRAEVNGTSGDNGSDGTTKSEPFVMIDGEKFVLVNSVVLLVNLVDEYCTTAVDLRVVSADLLTRLLDLLKMFSTRTMKLVHGGLARQVAGIKSITSRILAHSWRALELVIKLIPGIKKLFSQILPSKSLSMIHHFDDVTSSYTESVQMLKEKVVTSSREIVDAKLSKWEARPPVPSPQLMAITQHITLLEANLEESLPPEQLVQLLTTIDGHFKECLKSQIQRLNIVNDGGPQHGLVTQEVMFYVQTLNSKTTGRHHKFTCDDIWS